MNFRRGRNKESIVISETILDNNNRKILSPRKNYHESLNTFMNLVSSTMKYDKQSFKTKVNSLITNMRKNNDKFGSGSKCKTENNQPSKISNELKERILTPTNMMFSTNTNTNSNLSPDFLTSKENCYKTEDGTYNINTDTQDIVENNKNYDPNDNKRQLSSNTNKDYFEFDIKKYWKLIFTPVINFFMSNNFKIKMNHETDYRISKSNLQLRMFVKFTGNRELKKICFKKEKGNYFDFENIVTRAEYEIIMNDDDFQINSKK